MKINIWRVAALILIGSTIGFYVGTKACKCDQTIINQNGKTKIKNSTDTTIDEDAEIKKPSRKIKDKRRKQTPDI